MYHHTYILKISYYIIFCSEKRVTDFFNPLRDEIGLAKNVLILLCESGIQTTVCCVCAHDKMYTTFLFVHVVIYFNR